jgi:hypothetical protein
VAAAVIVGAVVIFPGVLSNSDSDGGVAMVSSEIDTTVPAASFADESAGSADDGGSDAAAPEATENDVAGGSSAEQEIQSATTAAAYDSADAAADLPYLVDVDIDALEDELASDPDFLRNSISTPSTKSSALDTARGDACLDSLRFDDTTSSFTPVATTTYENTEAVVVIVSPADGDPYLAVFDVDPCRELASSKG